MISVSILHDYQPVPILLVGGKDHLEYFTHPSDWVKHRSVQPTGPQGETATRKPPFAIVLTTLIGRQKGDVAADLRPQRLRCLPSSHRVAPPSLANARTPHPPTNRMVPHMDVADCRTMPRDQRRQRVVRTPREWSACAISPRVYGAASLNGSLMRDPRQARRWAWASRSSRWATTSA